MRNIDLLWPVSRDIDAHGTTVGVMRATLTALTVSATEQHYQAQMIVEDEQFNVHSLVLILESPVFMNMFTAPPDTPDPIAS